jgi:hypothetical protein
MNVYIWRHFAPDYSDGLAVAVAPDETRARELVQQDRGYDPDDWGPVEIYSIWQVAKMDGIAASVAGGG